MSYSTITYTGNLVPHPLGISGVVNALIVLCSLGMFYRT